MPVIEVTPRNHARLMSLVTPLMDLNEVLNRLLDMAGVEVQDGQAGGGGRVLPKTPDIEVVPPVSGSGMGAPQGEPPGRVVLSEERHRRRAKHGTSIHRDEYIYELLLLLEERGGWMTTRDIRPELRRRLGERLKGSMLDSIPSDSRDPRWWNHARFARQRMVDEGLVSDGEHGIWRLTKEGSERAQRARREGPPGGTS